MSLNASANEDSDVSLDLYQTAISDLLEQSDYDSPTTNNKDGDIEFKEFVQFSSTPIFTPKGKLQQNGGGPKQLLPNFTLKYNTPERLKEMHLLEIVQKRSLPLPPTLRQTTTITKAGMFPLPAQPKLILDKNKKTTVKAKPMARSTIRL